jgi:hypothetical protein
VPLGDRRQAAVWWQAGPSAGNNSTWPLTCGFIAPRTPRDKHDFLAGSSRGTRHRNCLTPTCETGPAAARHQNPPRYGALAPASWLSRAQFLWGRFQARSFRRKNSLWALRVVRARQASPADWEGVVDRVDLGGYARGGGPAVVAAVHQALGAEGGCRAGIWYGKGLGSREASDTVSQLRGERGMDERRVRRRFSSANSGL